MNLQTPMISQRILLRNLLVLARTNYLTRFRDTEQTVYRIAMRDDQGRDVVYTGKDLHLKVGDVVTLRATVKRFEGKFMRVSRPKIVDETSGIN